MHKELSLREQIALDLAFDKENFSLEEAYNLLPKTRANHNAQKRGAKIAADNIKNAKTKLLHQPSTPKQETMYNPPQLPDDLTVDDIPRFIAQYVLGIPTSLPDETLFIPSESTPHNPHDLPEFIKKHYASKAGNPPTPNPDTIYLGPVFLSPRAQQAAKNHLLQSLQLQGCSLEEAQRLAQEAQSQTNQTNTEGNIFGYIVDGFTHEITPFCCSNTPQLFDQIPQ